MRTTYEPTMTMREARARYFAENRFGDDGGYGAKWVDFKLGPIPMPIPNAPSRVRAVRYHDLHHILTGYATDTLGEFEISAWEIGGDCRDYAAAWALNLGGLAGGLLSIPRRTFRAYLRGRRSRTLYGRDLDALLELRVAEARAIVGLDADTAPARASDYARFALVAAGALFVGTVELLAMIAIMPVAVPAMRYARRRAREAEPA